MPAPKGAGDLRQRIGFQRRADTDDGFGNVQGEWTDLGLDRWGSLTPTRGGETVQAGRLAGMGTWDLWVRNDSGTRSLTVGDRAIDLRSGQPFNIGFGPADMDGRRQWLFLQLTSGGADG